MEGNRYTLDEIEAAMRAVGLDSEVVGNVCLQLTKNRKCEEEKKNGNRDDVIAEPGVSRAKTYPIGNICPVCGYLNYTVSIKNG